MTRIRFEGCSRSIAQSQPDDRRPSEQHPFWPEERFDATRYDQARLASSSRSKARMVRSCALRSFIDQCQK
jgi:hypothetical protein